MARNWYNPPHPDLDHLYIDDAESDREDAELERAERDAEWEAR